MEKLHYEELHFYKKWKAIPEQDVRVPNLQSYQN
jgi:hypothetical protein